LLCTYRERPDPCQTEGVACLEILIPQVSHSNDARSVSLGSNGACEASAIRLISGQLRNAVSDSGFVLTSLNQNFQCVNVHLGAVV